jgi:signal transduction histidine kinase
MNFSLLEKLARGSGDEMELLVAASREIAGQCSREICSLSYLLHPPLLDEIGLLFAIRWVAEGYSSRTGILVQLELPERFPRLAKRP